MAFKMNNLVDLISLALKHKASDIHIRTDELPSLRIFGDLVPIQTRPFSSQDILDILQMIVEDETVLKNLLAICEWDGSYSLENSARLRINFFRYMGKMGIVLRILPKEIPSIDELSLPSQLKKIAEKRQGLILVTGPTGSGKSTTLASMLRHINENHPLHIVTLEDPIEYVHTPQKSKITQREVGHDTKSFADGLRSLLRQDPDVILIGEMRDKETVSTALKAAETGHTVFGTLHTTNTTATINRMISMFPPEEHNDIKRRIADSLYASIGQKLLTKKDGSALIAAMEIMIMNQNISDCILGREPFEKISDYIARGKGKNLSGTQSFDQHLMELLQNKMISRDEALLATHSSQDFLTKIELT